jgi:hypothetical protein
LVGFTDGEGNFYIGIGNNGSISFSYTIKLHMDELKTLEYIKSKLNCGSIQISSTENAAYYKLGGLDEIISKVFPLFNKYLDYLAFKQAIEIYKNDISKAEPLRLKINKFIKKFYE